MCECILKYVKLICIEDIYFFEMNTKYISSSVLIKSKFSLVLGTREIYDVFNSRVEIYLIFTDAENAKAKTLVNPEKLVPKYLPRSN